MSNDNSTTEYLVLKNDEDQYSLWSANLQIPTGWHDSGCRGDKEQCISFIESVWTDMRPRSLRQALERV